MTSELEQLKARRRELRDELDGIKSRIHEIRLAEIKEQFGVKAGSLVKDSRGDTFKVAVIDTMFPGRPWLRGFKMKKNGDPSQRLLHIGSQWELVND